MMPKYSARDSTSLAMVGIVAFFVVASMVVVVILAFKGQPSGENIWAGLFSIVTAILGGITGYIGGSATRNVKAQPPTIQEGNNNG